MPTLLHHCLVAVNTKLMLELLIKQRYTEHIHAEHGQLTVLQYREFSAAISMHHCHESGLASPAFLTSQTVGVTINSMYAVCGVWYRCACKSIYL